jgi:hypothetical protein
MRVATTIESSGRRHCRRGSALLMVIWLIAMLSLIIYSTVRIVAHDMDLTIAQKQGFRARQLAEMGINIAMNPVVKEYDAALLNMSVETNPMLTDGETVVVKIRGEGGRFNLNRVLQSQDRVLLERMFSLWGLGNDDADTLIDRLMDWTDQNDQTTLKGMEREEYEELGYIGYPFNRPFYSLDEVLLVPGFDVVAANAPDWRDFFTIYSSGGLDLNEAEPKVLAAAMLASSSTSDAQDDYGRFLEEATEFVQTSRWGADGIEDTEDDQKIQDINTGLQMLGIEATDPMTLQRFGLNEQTVHIESVATVGEYRKRVVLIVRGRNANPQILTREEVPLFE